MLSSGNTPLPPDRSNSPGGGEGRPLKLPLEGAASPPLGVARGYPERSSVPPAMRRWEAELPGYAPAYFEASGVIKNDLNTNPHGVADPRSIAPEEFRRLRAIGHLVSLEGEVQLDAESGRPLNPHGRTGIAGRGALHRWGANRAADPIITRENEITGALEVLLIKRPAGEWALPGGFVDSGESTRQAAARELVEETGLKLDFSQARKVYSGSVADPRSTDNAWIETEAYHLHSPELSGELRAGDDASEAAWLRVSPELLERLYAGHGRIIQGALAQLVQRESALPPLVSDQIMSLRHEPLIFSYRDLGHRIGLFGGSFDPIHLGHLATARAAGRELGLDAVVLVPAKQNPLKTAHPGGNGSERIEMARRAIGDDRLLWIDPHEARSQGLSYTIDTIRRVQAECGPKVDLALIVGADCLQDLPRWRDIGAILRSVTLVVVERAGYSVECDGRPLVESLGGREAAQRMHFVSAPCAAVSSSDIRRALGEGTGASKSLDPVVRGFIEERGLYRKPE